MSKFQGIVNAAGLDLDTYDKWGTYTSLHFDVAEVLDMTDIEGEATPQPFARWQYRRGAFTVPSVETVAARAEDFAEGEWADDYSYNAIQLASAFVNGDITQQDLIYMGDVLSRYTSLLESAGESY